MKNKKKKKKKKKEYIIRNEMMKQIEAQIGLYIYIYILLNL